jgi:hypothetical protein
MDTRTLGLATLALLGSVVPCAGQGIAIDQGDFQLSIGGRVVGTESFVIRRAGVGGEGNVFANATVTLDIEGGRQVTSPLLSTASDGTAASYQVDVTGPGRMELRLNQNGRRYVMRVSSDLGREDQEFPAHPQTRILERRVAHQYYFLRDVTSGESVPVLEPRTRRQLTLRVGDRTEVRLEVGRTTVPAWRVELSARGDQRAVWFDRQGRVLRLEVPADGYVAQRTDLVG